MLTLKAKPSSSPVCCSCYVCSIFIFTSKGQIGTTWTHRANLTQKFPAKGIRNLLKNTVLWNYEKCHVCSSWSTSAVTASTKYRFMVAGHASAERWVAGHWHGCLLASEGARFPCDPLAIPLWCTDVLVIPWWSPCGPVAAFLCIYHVQPGSRLDDS